MGRVDPYQNTSFYLCFATMTLVLGKRTHPAHPPSIRARRKSFLLGASAYIGVGDGFAPTPRPSAMSHKYRGPASTQPSWLILLANPPSSLYFHSTVIPHSKIMQVLVLGLPRTGTQCEQLSLSRLPMTQRCPISCYGVHSTPMHL